MSGGRRIIKKSMPVDTIALDADATKNQVETISAFVTRVRLTGFGPSALNYLPVHISTLILECKREKRKHSHGGATFQFLMYLPPSITHIHIACKITLTAILNLPKHIQDITYDATLPADTISEITIGIGMRRNNGYATLKRKEPPATDVKNEGPEQKRQRIEGVVIDLTGEPDLPLPTLGAGTFFHPERRDEELNSMEEQIIDLVSYSEWSETPPSSPRR